MREYDITGMSCSSCSAHVEKAVRKVDGVKDVSVSLLTNSMRVEGDAPSDAVIAAVVSAGYGASLSDKSKSAVSAYESETEPIQDQETTQLVRRLISSIIILLPLMYVSMGHMMWNWPLPGGVAHNHVAVGLYEMLLTILIMVINQKFFISGFKGLFKGAPNMDTLVAMGAGASFAYSTWAMFAMTAAQMRMDSAAVADYLGDLYFDSAAMILTLITIGKTLESYSKGRTTDALKSLMKLAPKTARVIRDGTEETIPVEQVRVGDLFAVRPGESLPVDGVVVEGSSAVDESALTGESIPVDKTEGSSVFTATINQSGFLKCRAERVGEDTSLSQIIEMVRDAATSKAPIQKLADRVSGVFVPTVLVIAAVTLLIWILVGQPFTFSLSRAVSVLVISCPCALGLATPVAIMVGSGVGAKNGILFKTAESLEEAGKIDVVALDKTGTITTGEPKVTDIIPAEGVTKEELIRVAGVLEKNSEHPLAKAIMEYANESGIELPDPEDFQAVAGSGLTGRLGSDRLYGGNRTYISSFLKFPSDIAQQADTLAESGKTPLFFAVNDRIYGMIAVADVMKEEAPETVRQLKQMGINVVMLTGDNERTAKAIGKQVGIDDVISDVLPGGKESEIKTLSAKGKVAMVGDGINDAPALTRADTGIAIGAGADIAMEAADVVLVKSRLDDVPAAVRISRRVLRIIRQNLFWALIYNVIGIPLAAGAWYYLLGWKLNPMFCAAAMSVSSFIVVMNALRLNFLKVYDVDKDKPKKERTKTMEKTIEVKGMMCENCERHVKNALESIDGVTGAVASHEKGTAIVTMDREVGNETLKKAVEEAGYEVSAIC
ncbi:MAG: heavy metal translocating P-type ATPase [Lachnospiraceae bacterium]|nr:heavy metal translocating P-type ATPase [Lachnospiraceae bacterium]